MAWPDTVRKGDIEITWFSGSGAGGQHRNRHPNCCRMVHKPTGIRATATEQKSREQNRKVAFRRLVKQLIPRMLPNRPNVKVQKARIRTYHIPDQRVIDHRVPGLRFDPSRVLDGDIDPIHKEIMRGL